MNDTLDRMLSTENFQFQRLIIDGIDNEPVLAINHPNMRQEEICLIAKEMSNTGDYVKLLHQYLTKALDAQQAAPVVRFADGEYAFYAEQLKCNGLYRQAESVKAIRKALPFHLAAFKTLLTQGKAAPLIFPGNTQMRDKGVLAFLKKSKRDSSARDFLDFLSINELALDHASYIPFFSVYAYLTSKLFFQLVDGRTICIINSENREDACRQWFLENNSRPNLLFVTIPDAYVATRWPVIKSKVLQDIPHQAELCIVGAGIGALPVCVDVALHHKLPAIDAGHVINMMNGLVIKSNGPRLYTIWSPRQAHINGSEDGRI